MSKLLEKIPELIGWLQIDIAPTIVGVIAGVLISSKILVKSN